MPQLLNDGKTQKNQKSFLCSFKDVAKMGLLRLQTKNACPAAEIQKMVGNAEDLYIFALDELNFASDPWGSLYYEGNRISAREAIDNCTNAFMQALHQVPDQRHRRRSLLRASITPKLARLEGQYDALPPLIH